jgi:hypothetical protein
MDFDQIFAGVKLLGAPDGHDLAAAPNADIARRRCGRFAGP